MSNEPENLPALPAGIDISKVALPAEYERMRKAIADFDSFQQCQKLEAVAAGLAESYRVADDREPELACRRIRLYARRRYGELLARFDARGAHRKSEAQHTLSAKEVAAEHGASKHYCVVSGRMAKIPEQEFVAAVEQAEPPSLTMLSNMGRKARRAEADEPVTITAKPHHVGTVAIAPDMGDTREIRYVLALCRKLASRTRAINLEDCAREFARMAESDRKAVEGFGEFIVRVANTEPGDTENPPNRRAHLELVE